MWCLTAINNEETSLHLLHMLPCITASCTSADSCVHLHQKPHQRCFLNWPFAHFPLYTLLSSAPPPTPPQLPRIFHNVCFSFFLGITIVQEKLRTMLVQNFFGREGGGVGETRCIIEDERKQAINLTWFQPKQSLETQQYWQNRVLYHSERLQLHLLVDFWVMHAVWSSHHLFLHPRLLLVRIDRA